MPVSGAGASVSGVGVHSGLPATVHLEPAPRGSGLRFVSRDGDHSFVARPDLVLGATMQTSLGTDAFSVSTAEHLLAACSALGVWDLTVRVDGDELPIGDGSAQPWVTALDSLAVSTASPAPFVVTEPIEVREGDRLARLEPADGCFVSCSLSPREGLGLLGPLTVELSVSPDTFRRDLAWARTWAFAADAERLLAAGYGAGATLENTLLVTADGVSNPGGVRGPSEPVRHKVVDALGDLALLGRPFVGRLVLVDSGHSLHTALAQAVWAQMK
ncbi:MAG: UDP-3-O-acyl-N-acetylglucosamine deacetylase [Deltaproteobacteria bacterium]|nr:UDP-3-O-acyl-N-acetylglucosamine deacetylase [Deltaproteobacteria bacterium]